MYGLTLNGCKQGDFVCHIAEINIIGKALDRLKNLFFHAHAESVADFTLWASCLVPKTGQPPE